MKYLHILNGDGTAGPFRESDLGGTIMVWREMMAEGPVAGAFTDSDFWQQRSGYLSAAYGNYSDQAPDYFKDVLTEKTILDQVGQNTEVVLWFEHDLFCQANLWFLLAYLEGLARRGIVLSVVSPDSHPEVPGFRGMGQLMPRHFNPLFKQRIPLDYSSFEYSAIWKAYTASNPLELDSYRTQAELPGLPWLDRSIRAHFSRFPAIGNGLSAIQHSLLSVIRKQELESLGEILKAFWDQDDDFGWGDWQLLRELIHMSPTLFTQNGTSLTDQMDGGPVQTLFRVRGPLRLTPAGEAVLQGRENASTHLPPAGWLGGVNLEAAPAWCWDETADRLIACP